MELDAGQILSDPHWFLDDVDSDRQRLMFVRTSRTSLSQATFLDHRWTDHGEPVSVPFDSATTPPRLQAGLPLRFILHTAFCCSTLLARSIDVAGQNLSLKEPKALLTLANMKRAPQRRAGVAAPQKFVGQALRCFGRSFDGRERTTIKPSNFCNNLAMDMLSVEQESRALLLYSTLRSFLISIIKKREHGRNFARKLFSTFNMDSDFAHAIPPHQLLQMTDLQIATLAWLMQITSFQNVLSRFSPERVVTLDADALLADPTETLARMDGFFGLGIGAARLSEIAQGPVFRINSKNERESFDASVRANESVDVERTFGPDLDLVVNWAAKAWPQLRPLEALPRSLMG